MTQPLDTPPTATPMPPALVEGPELTLNPEDRFVDAAYRVLRRHFRRMLWNEPGTREGTDPTALHDMRVSARRLRAALGVFREELPASRVKTAQARLRRLGRTLGAVRDLDVQMARLDGDAQAFPEPLGEALNVYRAYLAARRERARGALLKTLSSRGLAGFVERFGRWLDKGPPKHATAAGREKAASAGARIVRRRLKKVLKAGRLLTPESLDAELHAERIRCKRLRYACEFFADLLGPEAQEFTARVVEIQDVLGEQHDAVVSGLVLGEVGRELHVPARLRRQTFMMLGHRMAQAAANARVARARFLKMWKRFDRRKTRKALTATLKRLAKDPPARRARLSPDARPSL